MKIVATADTHFPIKEEMFPDGDVLVVAGDLMYSGMPREWYPRLGALEKVASKYSKALFVPGNHDLFFEHYAGPCLQEMRKAGVHVLSPTGPSVVVDGVSFIGNPYVTGLPNWAYNWDEDSIWGYLDALGRADIVISHAPPRGVLDSDGKGYYGTAALRKYMGRFEPDIIICGHVHEGYGQRVVGRTRVYNVAMCDADYEQVNLPMVIDL